MGILYGSDRQKGVTIVVWDGVVTWDDWQRQVSKLTADPAFPLTSRLLADLETVTDTSTIGDQQVHEAVALYAAHPDPLAGKRIAIIARDEFQKAGRFGDLIARFDAASIVFNSLDTACTFLGLDLEEIREVINELRAVLRKGEN